MYFTFFFFYLYLYLTLHLLSVFFLVLPSSQNCFLSPWILSPPQRRDLRLACNPVVVVLVGIGTMLVGTLKQFGDGMEPPRPLSLTIIRCIWVVVLHEPMINWNKVSNTHIKKEKEKKNYVEKGFCGN